jgi:hypothetical protein
MVQAPFMSSVAKTGNCYLPATPCMLKLKLKLGFIAIFRGCACGAQSHRRKERTQPKRQIKCPIDCQQHFAVSLALKSVDHWKFCTMVT